jgi:hypothetical protein
MTPWEIVWFLIPMRLFRPLVNRQFMRRLPWESEKNLSRLSSQWIEAASCSIDHTAKQAGEFIKNEITTVENILADASDNREDIEKAISELMVIEADFKRPA